MPLGVGDSWVDGHESYVLVASRSAAAVAERFGRPVRWWPIGEGGEPGEPWLTAPPHEETWLKARARIRAFAAREQDLSCVLVQGGDSNGAVWSEDGDYLRPMYEDALAAMRADTPSGPELYESPVRIAVRLSAEMSTMVAALWGSDEAPGLEGISLWDGGVMRWSASKYTAAEIETALGAHLRDEEDGDDDEGGDSGDEEEEEEEEDWAEDADLEERGYFFLVRPGQGEERIQAVLSEWADAELREVGLGVDLSMSPHNLHPFDVLRLGESGLGEFVVAVGE